MTLAINTATAAVIVVMFVAVLFAVVFGLSFTRTEKTRAAAAPGAAPAAPTPPPISRRDFFRKSLLTSLLVFGAQFGGASLAFLWPNLRGGFGAAVNAGSLTDLKAAIQDQNSPVYIGAARAWVAFYGDTYKGIDAANGVDYASEGLVVQGVMALYQKCAHLGCRVPFCQASQWFECPCHGSKYNKAGEYKLGPAPQGLWHFPISLDAGGNLIIDTGNPLLGSPRGTDTIKEPPQGPFCVATA